LAAGILPGPRKNGKLGFLGLLGGRVKTKGQKGLGPVGFSLGSGALTFPEGGNPGVRPGPGPPLKGVKANLRQLGPGNLKFFGLVLIWDLLPVVVGLWAFFLKGGPNFLGLGGFFPQPFLGLGNFPAFPRVFPLGVPNLKILVKRGLVPVKGARQFPGRLGLIFWAWGGFGYPFWRVAPLFRFPGVPALGALCV